MERGSIKHQQCRRFFSRQLMHPSGIAITLASEDLGIVHSLRTPLLSFSCGCRYDSAIAMLNDTLLVHGGRIASDLLTADMAAIDLSPLLDIWLPGKQITCDALDAALSASPAFAWSQDWRVCRAATGAIAGHAMAVVPASVAGEEPAVLLQGGFTNGTQHQV